ncbi:hypothetical protein O181_090349 [Austropuccinia psidii MF-1]|uniref:Uncharacterized protein n=1 Tax=Austropuccinia psidii MF-1 TaxID=1389203 RepID=A0A9Q3IV95_9BASI|nr:hypothetical protein [Austropuccinia psidii MF-1]
MDTKVVFPHHAGSIGMKTEIVVMDNCTSKHIILRNYYLNIYGIDINNPKDIYFTIGKNRRETFDFSNMHKQISVVSSNKHKDEEEFVTNQLSEAQISPKLSLKMKKELIYLLYAYKNSFSSDYEPLGTIRRNEVDITLNIELPYPPVL